MAGRPTVVSNGLVATLAEHIREGTYAWVAAEAAWISLRTFYYWMARGERGLTVLEAIEWHNRLQIGELSRRRPLGELDQGV